MKRRRLLFAQAILALATVGCGSVSCGVMDWSPDGRQIVTVWPSAAGPLVLRIVDVETGRGRVIPGSSDALMPLWSPDQSAIAFVKFRRSREDDLCIYDVASAKTRRLRSGAVPLVWREDGARLLTAGPDKDLGCLSMPDGTPTWEARMPSDAVSLTAGEWVPDTDQVVVRALFATAASVPHGEPDTDQLVVNARSDLWLIEGAEPVRLTKTGDVLGFALRPGGKELIWARKSRDSRYILLSLYAMPLKWRGSRRLPFPHKVAQINPFPRSGLSAVGEVVFSPDGKRMAVTCEFTTAKGRKEARCYSMALDGSDARLVRVEGARHDVTPGAGTVRFSPDGRRLALLAEDAALVVCNADGTGCRVVSRTSSTTGGSANARTRERRP